MWLKIENYNHIFQESMSLGEECPVSCEFNIWSMLFEVKELLLWGDITMIVVFWSVISCVSTSLCMKAVSVLKKSLCI